MLTPDHHSTTKLQKDIYYSGNFGLATQDHKNLETPDIISGEPKNSQNLKRMQAYGLASGEQMTIKVLLKKRRDCSKREFGGETSKLEMSDKNALKTPRNGDKKLFQPVKPSRLVETEPSSQDDHQKDEYYKAYTSLEAGLRFCSVFCHNLAHNIFIDPCLTSLSPYLVDQEKSMLEEASDEDEEELVM